MTRSTVGFVIFLVVAVGALYGLSRLTQRLGQPETPSAPVAEAESVAHEHEGHEHEGEATKTASPSVGQQMGSPDAKVKIEAVIPPSDCQMPTLRMLEEIGKADPKRVRVEIYPMGSPAAQKVASKYNKFCAAVFINGRTDFVLTSAEGGKRQVICEKSPGMSYQPADLVEIVHRELQRAYGKGFDEATLKNLRAKAQVIMTGTAHSEAPSPTAKVRVEVLMPMQQAPIYNLFAQTVRELEKLKEKHGNDLSLTVYVLSTYEGQKRMQALNLNGPGVIINGKTVHEIPGPSGTKRRIVTAYGQSTRTFTAQEVVEVVQAYLKQKK